MRLLLYLVLLALKCGLFADQPGITFILVDRVEIFIQLIVTFLLEVSNPDSILGSRTVHPLELVILVKVSPHHLVSGL